MGWEETEAHPSEMPKVPEQAVRSLNYNRNTLTPTTTNTYSNMQLQNLFHFL